MTVAELSVRGPLLVAADTTPPLIGVDTKALLGDLVVVAAY